MRRRLSDLIGSAAYRVRLSTFHSWCQEIIDTYSESFPEIIGARAIGDAEKIQLLDTIMDDLDLPLLRRNGSVNAYTKDLAKAISDIKREGVLPEHFTKIVADTDNEDGKIVDKNRDLAAIYAEYEKRLSKTKRYDFDDMIVEVLRAIKSDADLRIRLQEEYQYVLVDEHQDTNNAQNAVIETLMSFHENPNLFVVGDEKQAIFRFQGASLDNFKYFKDKYHAAKLVQLSENYRSHGAILEAAGGLLGGGTLTANKKTKEKETISLATLPTTELERYFVAKKIKDLIAPPAGGGAKPEEIAVIYRDNKYAGKMSAMLTRMGVPHRVEGKEDLFREPDVRATVVILRAVHEFGLDAPLAEAIMLPTSGISAIDAARITRFAHENWREGFGIWDVLANDELLSRAKVANPQTAKSFAQFLNRMHEMSQETDLCTLVEAVMKESGILKRATDSTKVLVRFSAIRAFVKIIEETCEAIVNANLHDLFAKIETMERHGLASKRTRARKDGFVRLMTAHGAKGLEFDHVFIVHAMDGIWGGRRKIEKMPLLPEIFFKTSSGSETKDEGDSDERRLFYVALTRAKESITITSADRDDSERERAPSRFVAEIDEKLLFKPDVSAIEGEYEKLAPKLFAETKPAQNILGEEIDQKFIAELFDEEGLSATALNNYLDCPWKYFYRNLIRLPEAREPHLFYGSAMHKAIERYVLRRKDEDVTDSYLLAAFEEALYRQPIPKRETDEYLKRGTEALTGWLAENKERISDDALPEFTIHKLELEDGILINGKLDRVDGGTTGRVHVVDYKTGTPKSRNHIMGGTKDSNGGYYRQLTFYKLLLSLYKDGSMPMASGEINFLEPNDSGKYKREEFIIADEEVEELKKTILRVADEIRNFAFAGNGCGKDDCDYCRMAESR